MKNNDFVPPSAVTERSLLRDTAGVSAVEYLILVALIALAAIAGWRAFGTSVNEKAIDLGNQVRDLQ